MKPRLAKFSEYYYEVEIFELDKMQWKHDSGLDTLKDAQRRIEKLVEIKGIDPMNIRVKRVTYYDVLDAEDQENWRALHTKLENELRSALQLLEEIEDAGYIAWTSPSPSSSECNLRNSVTRALNEIRNAIIFCVY